MNELHEYAAYFSIALGSVVVVAVSLYAAVQCFRIKKFLAAYNFLTLVGLWFFGNVLLSIFFLAIATPNSQTSTSIAEYVVAPVYLIVAGLVCYVVTRYVRTLPSASSGEVANTSQCDAALSNSECTGYGFRSFLQWIVDHKRKMAGLIFVAIGAAAMSSWFAIEGILFVIVGVSLFFDARLWRN